MTHALQKLCRKKTLRVAGLMSGTSADGVDAAVVRIGPRGIKLLAFNMTPYRPALRERILALCEPRAGSVEEVCHLNFVIGELFAAALLKLCDRSGIAPDSIDLVGSHGQTVCHLPEGRRFGRRRVASTLQIGEPSVIAERTGITTVADFRPRDVAAGGQGAPLVPYSDLVLFGHERMNRAIVNIGGIANVTWLPAGADASDVLAFDTGPGNMVIDGAVGLGTNGRRHCDTGGRMAARGRMNESLLADMMKHPFLRKRPPKSTGREVFGVTHTRAFYAAARRRRMSPDDIAATATTFTSQSISQALGRFLPAQADEIILCGGGTKNRTLMKWLARDLAPAAVLTTDDLGIDADAKEAISFALLARETIRGLPGNVPSATGARKPVILGKIVVA